MEKIKAIEDKLCAFECGDGGISLFYEGKEAWNFIGRHFENGMPAELYTFLDEHEAKAEYDKLKSKCLFIYSY
jgi:hypothetical protein